MQYKLYSNYSITLFNWKKHGDKGTKQKLFKAFACIYFVITFFSTYLRICLIPTGAVYEIQSSMCSESRPTLRLCSGLLK